MDLEIVILNKVSQTQIPRDITYWKRKWQPTPIFLSGEEPGGLQSTGSQRAGHNLVTK